MGIADPWSTVFGKKNRVGGDRQAELAAQRANEAARREAAIASNQALVGQSARGVANAARGAANVALGLFGARPAPAPEFPQESGYTASLGGDRMIEDQQNRAMREIEDSATVEQVTLDDLLGLGADAAYGGSSSGGGGGGGGSSKAAPNLQAMIDYLESSRAGRLQPFEDMAAGVGNIYSQGQAQLAQASQAMRDRIAQAVADQTRFASERDASTSRSASTYANPGLDAMLADLQAQGASTAPLAAIGALRNQQGADLQAREAVLRSQLDAAMRQRLSGYDVASAQQDSAATSLMERNRAALMAQIARQRAAAEMALNDELAKLRMQASG